MATVYSQNLPSPYNTGFSGIFSRRETALLARGHSVVVLDSENHVIAQDDGITNVVSDAGSADVNLTLPPAATSKHRKISILVSDATNDTVITDASGANVGPTATLTLSAVGRTEVFSTGAAWILV